MVHIPRVNIRAAIQQVRGNLNLLDALLEVGADINAKSRWWAGGFGLLDCASPELAAYAIKRGAELTVHAASRLGLLEKLKRLITTNPALVHARGGDGQTPLHFASTSVQVANSFAHADVFQILLERCPDDEKLLNACWSHDDRTVDSLLARNSALAMSLSAASRRHLAHAARNNDLPAVRLMLKAGFPVDAVSQHNGTALHWAAWHGNAEIVQLILRNQPQLEDTRNDYQSTPLGWAMHGSENGWHRKTGDYAATVEALFSAGAKPPRSAAGSERVRESLRRYGVA